MVMANKTGGGPGTNQYGIRGNARAKAPSSMALQGMLQAPDLIGAMKMSAVVETVSPSTPMLTIDPPKVAVPKSPYPVLKPALKGVGAPAAAVITSHGRLYVSPRTGRHLPSVTNITGVIGHPGLDRWKKNQTLNIIQELHQQGLLAAHLEDQENWTKRKVGGRDRLQAAIDDEMGYAADRGSRVHAYAEAVVANAMGYEMEIPPIDDDIAEYVSSWETWRSEHDIEWLGIEVSCFNEQHAYAGTADLIAVIDGKLTLLDYKTSKQFYDSHALQLAALINCEYMLDGDNNQYDMYPIEQAMVLLVQPKKCIPGVVDDMADVWRKFRATRAVWDYSHNKPPIVRVD